MFCDNCGMDLQDQNQKFCPNCGIPLRRMIFEFDESGKYRKMLQEKATIMDQQKSEGFFTHSFENLKSMNCSFQIYSDWARGKREMVMISIVIKLQISPEIEESISALCKKFAENMRSEEEIFKGFYINDIKRHEEDQDDILKNEALIKKMVQDLHQSIDELIWEKKFGEKKT